MVLQLCCVEEDTEKMVQSIGPIHPDSCEAEFKHLKKGSYTVYLETHVSAPASCLPACRFTCTVVSESVACQPRPVTCIIVCLLGAVELVV